ncbi:hypothetical protein HYALB_00012964 [Hymenoscyphus albidus]|uniref:RED-like N-terminal domain-containing protein n=1 Tax=Hymenoscyphus albidus TaxID=595503 RepID=A0A9N9Q4Z3_9HELO|nr:hypothetical protein HYALB_00012964 [Hymenoscyphus albidus]
MNNNQFRKLVLDTPARQSSSDSKSKNGALNPSATPSLGSRARSSIPMTPRSIVGYSSSNEFARQLAAQNKPQATQKKFRSTAAPKGAKLAAGYTDRTKGREDETEESDKVKRIKALEEMMKLDQIDETTFVKLRDEILGDSIGGERAALVKGLDWALLERTRRGEVGVMDVLEGQDRKLGEEEEKDEGGEDVDDEFDELEERTIEAVVKEKVVKKGEMAPPSLTGKKRNRDQILAELKAARLAAKEASAPSLGSKFKKVGEKRSTSRIERDSKGREVLITVDENGVEKRKVRKAPIEPVVEKGHGLLMPDKDAVPLGMVVPEIPKPPEEDKEDIDIFDDVGDDYDPLAALEEDSSDEEKEDGEVDENGEKAPSTESKGKEKEVGRMPPPPPPQRRDYFGDTKPPPSDTEPKKPAGLTDPTLLAALKKASTLNPIMSKTPADEEEAAKAAKRKKMLQQDDRDAQDMDMGFGSSRFEDQDDGEEGGDGKRVKLSEWGADDDGEEEGKGGKGKRKRGPKKRKGDANSAKDVLAAIERRKGEK